MFLCQILPSPNTPWLDKQLTQPKDRREPWRPKWNLMVMIEVSLADLSKLPARQANCQALLWAPWLWREQNWWPTEAWHSLNVAMHLVKLSRLLCSRNCNDRRRLPLEVVRSSFFTSADHTFFLWMWSQPTLYSVNCLLSNIYSFPRVIRLSHENTWCKLNDLRFDLKKDHRYWPSSLYCRVGSRYWERAF